ncbi:transmembrane protein [Legionella drancourtii LLAP12]|uniref:Transmembrane protein n=1 Tax=Legionella drancourtii LLAP12 TaxID=658187 RepID=G9EUJ0_9GAMM|nr:transmembrane protein [Legionella drancourtii LLAP12]
MTMVVLRFIVDLLDNLIPSAYQPEQLLGHYVPGVGVIMSLALLLLTGVLATNFLGQRLVAWNDSLLSRIPLVRSIYKTVQQVINAVLSTNSEAFRKVVLIEYPRKGLWSIAFQTGVGSSEINEKTQEEMISVFIPTTPNPTSGFLIMVPKREAIELNMSIDAALKYTISLGVMQANTKAAALAESDLNKI